MNRPSSSAHRLFELVRGQDEPDQLARNRVARALSLRLAADASAMALGASVAKSSTGLGWVAAKSTLIVGITGAVVATGWLATRSPRPVAPAVTTPAQATPTAPSAPAVATQEELPAAVAAPATGKAEGKVPAVRRSARPMLQPETPKALGPASKTEDDLRPETEALRQAQQALRDKMPAQALKLLDTQDLRFRDGLLQQERAAVRVLALCQAGRAEEAKLHALRFEQKWPRSTLLGRVRAACWTP